MWKLPVTRYGANSIPSVDSVRSRKDSDFGPALLKMAVHRFRSAQQEKNFFLLCDSRWDPIDPPMLSKCVSTILNVRTYST